MLNKNPLQPYKGYTGIVERRDRYIAVSINGVEIQIEKLVDSLEDAQLAFEMCVDDYMNLQSREIL